MEQYQDNLSDYLTTSFLFKSIEVCHELRIAGEDNILEMLVDSMLNNYSGMQATSRFQTLVNTIRLFSEDFNDTAAISRKKQQKSHTSARGSKWQQLEKSGHASGDEQSYEQHEQLTSDEEEEAEENDPVQQQHDVKGHKKKTVKHECKDCSYVFSRSVSLKRHMEKHRRLTGVFCMFCVKHESFPSFEQLKEHHREKHPNLCYCNKCGMSFSNTKRLKR